MSKDVKDIFIHLFRIILKALTEALQTMIKVMLKMNKEVFSLSV